MLLDAGLYFTDLKQIATNGSFPPVYPSVGYGQDLAAGSASPNGPLPASSSILSTYSIDLWGQAALPAPPALGTMAAAGMGLGAGAGFRDPGRGQNVELDIRVVVSAASAGAPLLQVQLVEADDATLATNLTVISETTPAGLAVATLVQGYVFRIDTPPNIKRRFLGLKFINSVAATYTALSIQGAIALDRQSFGFIG